MIKAPKKLGIEESYLNIINITHDRFIDSSILKKRKSKGIP
jgi:hypothetical protein